VRNGNGGAGLDQSRWWAGDVHEMSGLRGFLGAGQRCNSRCAVAGAGVKRTVVWWFEGGWLCCEGFYRVQWTVWVGVWSRVQKGSL
jgi:hypothetical protein